MHVYKVVILCKKILIYLLKYFIVKLMQLFFSNFIIDIIK